MAIDSICKLLTERTAKYQHFVEVRRSLTMKVSVCPQLFIICLSVTGVESSSLLFMLWIRRAILQFRIWMLTFAKSRVWKYVIIGVPVVLTFITYYLYLNGLYFVDEILEVIFFSHHLLHSVGHYNRSSFRLKVPEN